MSVWKYLHSILYNINWKNYTICLCGYTIVYVWRLYNKSYTICALIQQIIYICATIVYVCAIIQQIINLYKNLFSIVYVSAFILYYII